MTSVLNNHNPKSVDPAVLVVPNDPVKEIFPPPAFIEALAPLISPIFMALSTPEVEEKPEAR